MLKNYIIIAHHKFPQLKRLIERLNDGESHFYVHIDKRVEDESYFSFLFEMPYVTVMPHRILCIWGDISNVEATLMCMEQIILDRREGYTILLSGQCYPLASNQMINRYLEENSVYDHININAISECWSTLRAKYYKIHFSTQKLDITSFPCIFDADICTNFKCFTRIVKQSIKKRNIAALRYYASLAFKKRKPYIAEQFGGSQWWSMSYPTLNKVINYVRQHPGFLKYHKHTLVADEIFFQTIVQHLRSTDDTIKIKSTLTYVNWEGSLDGCSPLTFSKKEHIELCEQRNQGKMFARKFDTDYCGEILDMLDKKV